jgi:hypothetical protein
VAQRGLAALGDLPNPDRARMLAAIGWILGLSGDYPAASAMLAHGRTLAEQLTDDQALAEVLHLHTIQHMAYAEFPDGIQDGLRAAEVFETHEALWELSSVLSFVGYQASSRAGAWGAESRYPGWLRTRSPPCSAGWPAMHLPGTGPRHRCRE